MVCDYYLHYALPQYLHLFSESTYMKFSILDIYEMSKTQYMDKDCMPKTVVPFFK